MHPVHVLHIGKTGGTAVKHALRPFADQGVFILHKHPHRLRDCPPDDLVFFVVRHPVDRFVSGFNSRLRRGRPRYDVAWTWRERLAFAAFGSPNQLAEAIGSRNPVTRAAARWAMRSIKHIGTPLSYWLDSVEYLTSRDRLIVGTVPTLGRDLADLLAVVGVTARADLPTDAVVAHATPPGMDVDLSARARANLAVWLADDIALYEWCVRAQATCRAPRDR
jgi:hypothetical protein